MFESQPPPEDPALLLRFTPVPLARTRASGWTAERQVAFIAALARTGVVRAAAASVGMSARSAYGLRARAACTANRLVDVPLPPDQLAAFGPGWTFSFAHAWDLALRHGLQLQMEAALPASIEPEREPIIRRGMIVGWRERFNTRVAMNALGAWRRYNEGAAYDHELRIAERTHHLAMSLEALFEKGPVEWPSPAQLNASVGCACCGKVPRDPPDGEGPDGFRRFGLLDPYGPADRPPRPAAEQDRELPPPRRPRPMPRITGL